MKPFWPRLDDIVVGHALRPQRPRFLLKWFLDICVGQYHSGSHWGMQICEKRFLLEAVPVVDPVSSTADLKAEENWENMVCLMAFLCCEIVWTSGWCWSATLFQHGGQWNRAEPRLLKKKSRKVNTNVSFHNMTHFREHIYISHWLDCGRENGVRCCLDLTCLVYSIVIFFSFFHWKCVVLCCFNVYWIVVFMCCKQDYHREFCLNLMRIVGGKERRGWWCHSGWKIVSEVEQLKMKDYQDFVQHAWIIFYKTKNVYSKHIQGKLWFLVDLQVHLKQIEYHVKGQYFLSLISESETHILYRFITHGVKYFKPLFLEMLMIMAYKKWYFKQKCQASEKYVHFYALNTWLGLLLHELLHQCGVAWSLSVCGTAQV